jgi:hypothetical protein
MGFGAQRSQVGLDSLRHLSSLGFHAHVLQHVCVRELSASTGTAGCTAVGRSSRYSCTRDTLPQLRTHAIARLSLCGSTTVSADAISAG